MRLLCISFLLLLTSYGAHSQTSDSAPRIRYSVGGAVHPGTTIVTQISGLARFPTARQSQYVVGGLGIGMVFYSREQQKDIGNFDNKAPYATASFGAGYGPVAASVGIGVRFEDRIRTTSGIATSESWMHTFAAHVFVTDNIGVRVEYLGPRWVLVGADIGI